MNHQKKTHFGIKTVVLGNYATGKTTLVERLTTGKIKPFTESTIGCAYSSLSRISNTGNPIQYQIWDTAGQEKYRALTELYYRNADIILICFDVADIKSFDTINVWIDLINDGCSKKKLIFLIANKDDLVWQVDKDTVEKIAHDNNMTLLITSSLKNYGINELLETIMNMSEIRWKDDIVNFLEGNENTVMSNTKKTTHNNCCY